MASGPETFAALDYVSRETLDRLVVYERLLRKWQPAINLVSTQSLRDVWRRHFLDSAQIYPLIPPGATNLLDIGSGAGFPGLVLAILGAPDVHLVEADQRKCAFLREVSRETATDVTIVNARLEAIEPRIFDVVTARGVAPLDVLLNLARPYLGSSTIGIFPKGRSVAEELTTARKHWNMDAQLVSSVTDSAGSIVLLEGISYGQTKDD